jgi:hypothetical protein
VNVCGGGFGPWLPENRSPPSSFGSHSISPEEQSPPPRPPQSHRQRGFPQKGPINNRPSPSDRSRHHKPRARSNNAWTTDLHPRFKAFLQREKTEGVDYQRQKNGVIAVREGDILRLYAEYLDRLRNIYNRR